VVDGGSVFSNVKLVSVMWNKDVNPTTSQAIPGFSAAIVDSTYLDQMSEYNTKGVQAINGHKPNNAHPSAPSRFPG
jgi:hypothetical protein